MATQPHSRIPVKLTATTLALSVLATGAAALSPEDDAGVFNKFHVDFYGYIKADAVYNTSLTNNGQFTRWVEPATLPGQDDSQFNITARQTRFGFNIKAPETEGITAYGKIEMDFYGGGANNSATPRLRHAFINLDWKDSDLSLLAGQTSDVISPLVATTVNYTVAWWTGDVGYRRNQIRLTKGLSTGEDSRFLIQLAVTQGNNAEVIGGGLPGGFGFQGRAAYSFSGLASRKTTVGISAHTADEAADTKSDSFNVDLDVPFTADMGGKAEWYSGKNMAPYLGGIGQSGDATTDVASTGFWAGLYWVVNSELSFNLGYAQDDPDDADLTAAGTGDRAKNTTLWVNAFHNLTPNTIAALELAQHTTDYLASADDSDSTTVQFALIYKF